MSRAVNTSVFMPREPHEQLKRQTDGTLKDELPRSVGAQYTMGDQWRSSFRKNEETEQKQKQVTKKDPLYSTGN